jgi:hypothetical protein
MTRSLLLFVSTLVFAACPGLASTYYVGTCHAKSFSTISAAISAVPAGSIVDVCPGEYSEQVIVSKSLTLQGITSQNGNTAEVCCGATNVAESVLGLNLIPTIWVTAGTVNISNLFVVASVGGTSGCPQLPTGIFYASGTSGTVNHVSAVAVGANCGVGIVAENATAHGSSIKIENSYIATDDFGLIMGSLQPTGTLPVLLNTITGNTLSSGLHGMLLLQSRGKISANNIIVSDDNTSGYGITDAAPETAIMDNNISGPTTGIIISAASSTVTGNKILTGIGIDLGCTLGTITNNTIGGANLGLKHTPSNFTGKNTFFTTGALISGGC